MCLNSNLQPMSWPEAEHYIHNMVVFVINSCIMKQNWIWFGLFWSMQFGLVWFCFNSVLCYFDRISFSFHFVLFFIFISFRFVWFHSDWLSFVWLLMIDEQDVQTCWQNGEAGATFQESPYKLFKIRLLDLPLIWIGQLQQNFSSDKWSHQALREIKAGRQPRNTISCQYK